MRGWDDAAAVIADAVEMFGPFDGVLGFSQGASAAALALALVPSLRDTVRFAVLFSGFEPMDPAATAALHAARITVRSMHVHGHADRMVSRERTEALARSFAHPEFFFHEGGHGVPLSKEFRDALRSFALNPAVNAATTTQLATSVTDERCHRSPLAIVHPPLSKPRHSLAPTRFLFVNGVGPCVGVSTEAVRESFGEYGDVDGVDVFDPSMARCVVTMARVEDAIAAQAATHETCRPDLGDRRLWVRFSSDPNATVRLEPESRAKQEETWCAATRDSATLGVPGVTLITDFVTEEEEREMLACVDSDERWQGLAKRRVLHYGYAFDYGTRDARDETSPMPAFVAGLLGRASSCGAPGACESATCDQLTVNEYVARRGDSAARGHAQRVWAHDFVVVARGSRGDGVSAARGWGERAEGEEGDIDASAVAAGSARRGEVQVVALHTASQAGRDCRRGRMRGAGGEEGELHVSAQEGGRVRVRVAGSLRQQGGCRTAVEGQGRARVGFVTVVEIAIHQTSLCPLTN